MMIDLSVSVLGTGADHGGDTSMVTNTAPVNFNGAQYIRKRVGPHTNPFVDDKATATDPQAKNLADFGQTSKPNGRANIFSAISSVKYCVSILIHRRRPGLFNGMQRSTWESAMRSTISNAKRSNSIGDIAAEQWSRLYVDIRASYGRASIQSALLLNGGASVALLAFLGNLAIAQQSKGLAGNFIAFRESFVCFGVGVMLAASSSVVAFVIQIVSIARPRDAESRMGLELRLVGIGMVVASLLLFAIGVTVAANTFGNLLQSADVAAQLQLEQQNEGAQPPPRQYLTAS